MSSLASFFVVMLAVNLCTAHWVWVPEAREDDYSLYQRELASKPFENNCSNLGAARQCYQACKAGTQSVRSSCVQHCLYFCKNTNGQRFTYGQMKGDK